MCFTFDSYLVAGFTPIKKGNCFDNPIYRPEGMRGFIINLTVAGIGVITTNNGEFLCKKGDLLIFPPDIIHHYARWERSDRWEHYWIYFFPRPFWITWLNWGQNDKDVGILSLGDSDDFFNIKALFIETIQRFSQNNHLSEAMAMNTLERIILEGVYCQSDTLESKKDPRIKEICDYLESNIESDVSIDELAEQVFLSPSRLSHLFKSEMGQTLNMWRESQRITKAKILLQTSSNSISDIASLIGYNDPFYFSKIFKRHCGSSPSSYRTNYFTSNKKTN
ncbi:arabinose operon transcriptional regulator AraC [Vibrio sp.]|nr:arabinose operon transcriptional regulator AraC [Vibrio sp.]